MFQNLVGGLFFPIVPGHVRMTLLVSSSPMMSLSLKALSHTRGLALVCRVVRALWAPLSPRTFSPSTLLIAPMLGSMPMTWLAGMPKPSFFVNIPAIQLTLGYANKHGRAMGGLAFCLSSIPSSSTLREEWGAWCVTPAEFSPCRPFLPNSNLSSIMAGSGFMVVILEVASTLLSLCAMGGLEAIRTIGLPIALMVLWR